jgi:hypothetical protein
MIDMKNISIRTSALTAVTVALLGLAGIGPTKSIGLTKENYDNNH